MTIIFWKCGIPPVGIFVLAFFKQIFYICCLFQRTGHVAVFGGKSLRFLLIKSGISGEVSVYDYVLCHKLEIVNYEKSLNSHHDWFYLWILFPVGGLV